MWTPIRRFKDEVYGSNYIVWDLFDKWKEGKGITHFASIYSKYTKYFPEIENRLLSMDHVYFFRNKNASKIWLTSQTYCPLDTVIDEIERYCKPANLPYECFDTSCSWYYPGRTHLLVITNERNDNT